jgi:hypothetical protein
VSSPVVFVHGAVSRRINATIHGVAYPAPKFPVNSVGLRVLSVLVPFESDRAAAIGELRSRYVNRLHGAGRTARPDGECLQDN